MFAFSMCLLIRLVQRYQNLGLNYDLVIVDTDLIAQLTNMLG